MGGAWGEQVPSFGPCGRSHEVRALGSLILIDSGCGRTAGLGAAARAGRDGVKAALKRRVPELGIGRSTLAPSLERRGWGGVPGTLGRGKGGLRAPHVSEETHAGRGKAAAGTGLWPPYSLGRSMAPSRSLLPCDVRQVASRPQASDFITGIRKGKRAQEAKD